MLFILCAGIPIKWFFGSGIAKLEGKFICNFDIAKLFFLGVLKFCTLTSHVWITCKASLTDGVFCHILGPYEWDWAYDHV